MGRTEGYRTFAIAFDASKHGSRTTIFKSVGLDKLNIGILDDDFLAEVKSVQNKKFSEMLSNVIARYQNRSIETAKVMEGLLQMVKSFGKRPIEVSNLA